MSRDDKFNKWLSQSGISSNSNYLASLQDFSVANKPVVMNKRELKKLIVQHGGTVLEEFPGPKQKIPDSVVLISDKFVAYLIS